MTYASEVLADSPILYLKLDEASGTVVDSSSSPRTITKSGGPTQGVSGVSSNAITFDGVDDYLSAASVSDFAGSSFTFEAWFKSSTSTGTPTFIRRDGNGRANLLRLNAGKVEFYANNASNAITTSSGYADGQWHHAVGVRNGTSTILYVDGVSVATGTATSGAQGSTAVYVGAGGAGAELMTGTLDEVAIYPTALSATRVGVHYSEGASLLANKTVYPTAAVLNLTAPAPVVTGQTRVVAGVSTLDLTAPDQLGYAWFDSTANAGTGMDTSVGYIDIDEAADAYLKFPDIGSWPTEAILRLRDLGVGDGGTIAFHRLTESFTNDEVVSTPKTRAATASLTYTWSAGAGYKDIDITQLMQDIYHAGVNYGFAMVMTNQNTDAGGSELRLASRNNATVDYRPRLTYEVGIEPSSDVDFVVPAAAELNLTAPFQRFGVGTTVSAGTGSTLDLTAPAPVVTGVKNVLVQVNANTLTLEAPNAITRNPDFTVHPGYAEMWLYVGDALGYGGSNGGYVVDEAAELTLETPDPTLNFQTDVHLYAQPAVMNLSAPAVFLRDSDRYYNVIPGTLDWDDVWLALDEISGTVANDVNDNVDPNNGDTFDSNGTYVGGPVLYQEGPHSRKSVYFDGVNDRVQMGAYYAPTTFSSGMDVTVEFAIKTTDLTGTIIDGIDNTSAYSTSEIRLVDGYLSIYNGSQYKLSWKVPKFIADNEWHHVVISFPTGSSWTYDAYNISGSANPYFVAIDGVVEWARYGAQLDGRFFIPNTVMARADGSNAVQGNLSHIVVRTNYAISEATAARIYYEWAEATVVRPEPAVLTLSAPHPAKAEGNMPKMIALYGLPYYLYTGFNQPATRDGFGTYYSTFAGYFIRNDAGSTPTGPGGSFVNYDIPSNGIPMVYLNVKPFVLEGYLVYPVAVMHQAGSNGGPFSASGLENGQGIDPITGEFIDDRTGLPRFIDLQNDLAIDLEDIDCITAVNYPAVRPDDGPENVDTSADVLREFRQHNMGLSNTEWAAARDKLRDSILDAHYNGVNLWIPEPHMAEHLGFINGWVKHDTGARVEFYGPGNIDATGYTNKRGQVLDALHIDQNIPGGQTAAKVAAPGVGQFNFTWQANAKRKIVSTEPGLTDLAGYEISERIEYAGDAAWTPHDDVIAYDLIDRTSGLIPGDELVMDMWSQDDYTGNYPSFQNWSVGDPRKFIVSAYPEGVVGKVISKEMDTYYGVNGVVRANPWKDNVYTIAAERGSVIRGRATGGRAFIELMDPDITRVKVAEDRDKSKWNGQTGFPVSSWSLDTRRNKEIFIVTILEKIVTRGSDLVVLTDEVRYAEIEDADVILQPFISMNARGLNWLKEASDIPEGEARVFASPAIMNLSAADAGLEIGRNINVSAGLPARLDLSAPVPDSVDDPDSENKVLPAYMDLVAVGTGKVVRPEAVVLTLTAGNAVGTGAGERIYLYVDAQDTITLFLKED